MKQYVLTCVTSDGTEEAVEVEAYSASQAEFLANLPPEVRVLHVEETVSKAAKQGFC